LNLRKDEWQEAYEAIMQMFEDFEEAAKINGKIFHQDAADRYDKIAVLCYKLFKGEPTNAKKIEIERPTNEKPFVGVIVHMDCFAVSKENKSDFFELLQLADDIVFYGDEEDYFHISFYVNDIWTEDGATRSEPMADA